MRNGPLAAKFTRRRTAPARALGMVVVIIGSGQVVVGDSAVEELAVRVTPSIVMAAQDVKALITVPRRPENRRLVVTVEGPAYYASTERQLDGDGAARMHEFAFRQLPEGEYRVQVIVEGTRGRDPGIETRFTVRGVLTADGGLSVASPRPAYWRM